MMKKLIVFILMLVLCSSVVFAQADNSRTNTILNALGAAKIGGGILIGFEAAFSPDYESVIVPGEEDRAIYIKGVIKQVPKIQYETLGKIFLNQSQSQCQNHILSSSEYKILIQEFIIQLLLMMLFL
ncbi:hypothetical protein KY326_00485 [Candidatus Woesearchaeota archaeon]|nr:hypothetical protein [Candidatus Woesearchaeota archaeon]